MRRFVTSSNKIVSLLASFIVVLLPVAGHASNELLVNGGFEHGLAGWKSWPGSSPLIAIDHSKSHSGLNSARINYGHVDLCYDRSLKPGQAYALHFFYQLGGENPSAQVNLSFRTPGGENRSAGFKAFTIAQSTNGHEASWNEFQAVFMASPTTTKCQIAFRAEWNSTLWLDDVSLTAVQKPDGLVEPPDPWLGLDLRTSKPLFHELLTLNAGNYAVVCWNHVLQRPDKLSGKRQPHQNDQEWRLELLKIFKEAGSAGMGFFMDVNPNLHDAIDSMFTSGFYAEQFRKNGARFDVFSEPSWSVTRAIQDGAEVLNPTDVGLGERPVVSLVDPKYVDVQEQLLRSIGAQTRAIPSVGVYYGKDEPAVRLPEGKPGRWGGYGHTMATETLHKYGFGHFAAPAPDDSAFQSDTNKPWRWIAYNRWMNDKFIESRQRLYHALHEVNPDARYSAANYWFMHGFVPFDYARVADCSDMVELDPYASSAESRTLGRGVYNHGFGAKFLSDLTGKPVRIIAQAFDYNGYSMTPENLREWVSQALRSGASAIDYYEMDNPRLTHPDRWKMMLYLSRQITRMNRIRLPDDPDTAVLYTMYTHMSQGENTSGDQMYAAHVLLGELAGSWFKFVSDGQLERNQASLNGYKAVYLPLAKYMTAEATRKIEEYVRAGGVLICGDAEAFTSDLAGNDTRDAHERILGFKVAGLKKAASMTLQSAEFGLPIGSTLRLLGSGPLDTTGPSSITLTDTNAVILAAYQDGTPAVISRRLGTGRVIAFAANPFVPSVAVEKSSWPMFFKGMQQSLGCKVERPIWHFLIPPP